MNRWICVAALCLVALTARAGEPKAHAKPAVKMSVKEQKDGTVRLEAVFASKADYDRLWSPKNAPPKPGADPDEAGKFEFCIVCRGGKNDGHQVTIRPINGVFAFGEAVGICTQLASFEIRTGECPRSP